MTEAGPLLCMSMEGSIFNRFQLGKQGILALTNLPLPKEPKVLVYLLSSDVCSPWEQPYFYSHLKVVCLRVTIPSDLLEG